MPHDELESVAALNKDKNSHVSFDGGMSARNEPRDPDDAVALKGSGGGVEGGGEEKGEAKPRSGGIDEGLVSRHRVKLFADGSLGL